MSSLPHQPAAAAASETSADAHPSRTADFGPRWTGPARIDLPAVVLLAIAALVATPFVNLLAIAASGSGAVWAHLADSVLLTALPTTLVLLAGVGAVAGLCGIATAWLVTVYRFPGRTLLGWLLPLPLAIPTYIVAYIYGDLLDAIGPVQGALRALFGFRSPADYWFPDIRSTGGAVFVMGFVLYPYVYLTARAMFLTQSANLVEVARTLGAGRLGLVRHVAIPLARPALAVGLSLVLLETLNDIGASEFLGIRTLTVSIFTTWLNQGDLAGAAQIAAVMLLVVVALLALEARGRRARRFAASTKRSRTLTPIEVRGWPAAAMTACCLVPVLFGLVVPGGYLVLLAVTRNLVATLDAGLLATLATTLALAGVATLATLAVGLVGVVSARLVRDRRFRTGLSLAGLGYAIPGTVLALALLPAFVGLDTVLAALAGAFGGSGAGLLVTGSAAGVVIAYVIRFLAIAVGSMQAGFSRISPNLDEAARTLGARPPELLRRIHLPLIRPALGGAALLVFVDCLKELPATLLLRPMNLETLATTVYGEASRGEFEHGALAALLIVAAGLVPVVHLTRFTERQAGNEALSTRTQAGPLAPRAGRGLG